MFSQGPADDTYVCSRSSPSSYTIKHSSAYLTGHKPPTLVTPVSDMLERMYIYSMRNEIPS